VEANFASAISTSVRHGDAVALPKLENWPLFGQSFSTFAQIILHPNVWVKLETLGEIRSM